jgi:hypothetical protein
MMYPEFKREVEVASEADVSDKTNDDTPLTTVDDEEADDDTTKVAYFGDQIRYSFKSSSTLTMRPVVYFPDSGVMLPVEMTVDDTDLSRKQMGNLMDDISGYHETVIDQLEEFTTEFDQQIMEARRLAIDFTTTEFSLSQFIGYLGIDNDEYATQAATMIRQQASNPEKPSIWNIQLGMKRTLLEEYDANKAGDTYQAYQEIAGQLLQYPDTQLKLALEEHTRQSTTDTDTRATDDNMSITDIDIEDIDVVGENNLPTDKAKQIQDQVDSRIKSE